MLYSGTKGVPRIEWEAYDGLRPLLRPPALPPIPYHPALDSDADFEAAKQALVQRLTNSLDEQRGQIEDQLRRRKWRPPGSQHRGRQHGRNLDLTSRLAYWFAICGKSVKQICKEEDPRPRTLPARSDGRR